MQLDHFHNIFNFVIFTHISMYYIDQSVTVLPIVVLYTVILCLIWEMNMLCACLSMNYIKNGPIATCSKTYQRADRLQLSV